MTRNDMKKFVEIAGINDRLNVANEECSELITAISHYKRDGKLDNLFEEIVDVGFIIMQLSIWARDFSEDLYAEIYEGKLKIIENKLMEYLSKKE